MIEMAKRKQSSKVRVGAPIDLGRAGFIRLPDGSVVSTSGVYTTQHEGEHVCDDGTTVLVGEPQPEAETGKPRRSRRKATEPEPPAPAAPAVDPEASATEEPGANGPDNPAMAVLDQPGGDEADQGDDYEADEFA